MNLIPSKSFLIIFCNKFSLYQDECRLLFIVGFKEKKSIHFHYKFNYLSFSKEKDEEW